MVGRADPPRGTAADAHREQPAARQRQQRRAGRGGGGRHARGGGRRRGGGGGRHARGRGRRRGGRGQRRRGGRRGGGRRGGRRARGRGRRRGRRQRRSGRRRRGRGGSRSQRRAGRRRRGRRRARGRGQRRGGRRRVAGRRRQEGGKHHVPVGGRAQGQARLLRAGGAGEDVLEVGGGAAVLHVEDEGHRLAASGSRPSRLAGGEDGRHDQLAGGDRGGRTRTGVGSHALRYQGLVERSHRGHMPEVRDRLLQIGGGGRRYRDHQARWRRGRILAIQEGDVARSVPRRRDRARPGAIDVVRDLHLARNVELTEPPDQQVAGRNRLRQVEGVRRDAVGDRGCRSLDEFGRLGRRGDHQGCRPR